MTRNRRRVYATYWPERHGSVIDEGAEVSEVAWDGGGVDRYVANKYLADVKLPQPRYKPTEA